MTLSPTTPNHTRQVTPSIRTTLLRRRTATGDQWVMAAYDATPPLRIRDPRDAPLCATRIFPAGQGRASGRWDQTWQVDIRLQVVEHSETAALAELIKVLDRHQVPYEREAVQAALVALASATADTPHSLQPMGARRPKPRRKRYTWLDRETGKRVNIYQDTMRMHADPRCVCRYCTIYDRPTTNETKANKK
jgi:hypothetical protein